MDHQTHTDVSNGMLSGDVAHMQSAVGLGAGTENGNVSSTSLGTCTFDPSKSKVTGLQPGPNADKLDAISAKMVNDAYGGMKAGDTSLARVYNGSDSAGVPNHYVTIGKDKSGQPYVYDPMGDPSMRTGNDAKSYLASKVGVALQDPVSNGNGTETRTIRPTLPLVKQGA